MILSAQLYLEAVKMTSSKCQLILCKNSKQQGLRVTPIRYFFESKFLLRCGSQEPGWGIQALNRTLYSICKVQSGQGSHLDPEPKFLALKCQKKTVTFEISRTPDFHFFELISGGVTYQLLSKPILTSTVAHKLVECRISDISEITFLNFL